MKSNYVSTRFQNYSTNSMSGINCGIAGIWDSKCNSIQKKSNGMFPILIPALENGGKLLKNSRKLDGNAINQDEKSTHIYEICPGHVLRTFCKNRFLNIFQTLA
jgi:hypothetical protein